MGYKSIKFTALLAHHNGLYKYSVMALELRNTTKTNQRAIDAIPISVKSVGSSNLHEWR